MIMRKRYCWTILLLFFLSFAAATAQPSMVCLPTCAGDDGRFFAIAGPNLRTLADELVEIRITAPAGAAEVQFGVFDGETGGLWDLSVSTLPLNYELFADPMGDATGTVLKGQWSGAAMPDNAWIDFSVPVDPDAQSPSGAYFYFLRISAPTPVPPFYLGAFKLRSNSGLGFIPINFAFLASRIGPGADQIIYPDFPNLTPTTYNGEFSFFFRLATSEPFFSTFDGDIDFGKFDGSVLDTDDPDTPNTLPSFATPSTVPEGAQGIGLPADDTNIAENLRTPSVIYELRAPDGQIFVNVNPSGNQEWEQFRVDTDLGTPADYHVSEPLPAGIYELAVIGLDMGNLNFLRPTFELLGVDEEGNPVLPPNPLLIEGTVFLDSDGDGIHDEDLEVGIPGVVVNLLDEDGQIIATAITDADGNYTFDVEPGTYTVEVAAENFEPGGALEGLESTTGGESQTVTVTEDNVPDVDFGYIPRTPVGTGTPGFWKNHPSAWPFEEIVLGGQIFSKSEAIAILANPTRNDVTLIMARHLIAAKLNVGSGTFSACIEDDIRAADAWLIDNPVGSGVKGGGNNSPWRVGQPIAKRLDDYNNGLLCAPHRD